MKKQIRFLARSAALFGFFCTCLLMNNKEVNAAEQWRGPFYVVDEEAPEGRPAEAEFAYWVCTNDDGDITQMKALMYYRSYSESVPASISVRHEDVFYDVPVTGVIGDSDLSITSVTIAPGVKEVSGFTNCDRLESVSLPEGLLTMNAFAECSALTELTIPDSVTSVSTFGDKTVLKKVVWPESTTSIPDYFFKDYTKLEEIVLPEGLAEIRRNAFENTSSLTAIELPERLETIGIYAFAGSGITELAIPDSVTSLGSLGMQADLKKVTWPGGISVVPVNSFNGYSALEEVILSEGVTEIEDYRYGGAFNNCTSLVRVTLPESLVKIGKEAFTGDISLREIINLESAEEIGERAFYNCPCPESLTLNAKTIGAGAFYGAADLKTVTLSEGMESIGNDVFVNTGITELVIPDTVTSLGKLGLESSLKKVTWPGGIPVVPVNSFHNYTALEQVILSEGVTELQDYERGGTFTKCTSLVSVTFPDSLVKIGKESFSGDTSLREIINLESAREIGEKAFYNCPCQESLTIRAKTIGAGAFYGAADLKNVTLSEGIESIGNDVFVNTGVTELKIPDTVTSLGSLGMKETLKKVTWPAGIPVVPVNSFFRYTALEEVVLSEGVTEIQDYNYGGTFTYCTGLSKVTLPSTLQKIGQEAFSGDTSLKELTLANATVTIGNKAFYQCNALTDIYYRGSYENWISLAIDSTNAALQNATVHYSNDLVHFISSSKAGNTVTAIITGGVKAQGIICASDTVIPTLNTPGITRIEFTESGADGSISLDVSGYAGNVFRAYAIYADAQGNDMVLYAGVE